ncbi:hypothetical protein OY671_010446, partial [Metschnikowia pulcherrima]
HGDRAAGARPGHRARPAGARRAAPQVDRLRAAERRGRLGLPPAGRGCRDDGPLRPHGSAAPAAPGGPPGRGPGLDAGRHGRLAPPADRRTLGRPAQARVPGPRAGAGCPRHPAGRTLHRRRRHHRGRDHRAAGPVARRRARDPGVHPQPGQRARVSRPRGAHQARGAGLRSDGP